VNRLSKNFLTDGLSIDETRVSVLMLILVVSIGFAMYQVVVENDVSENLLTLLGYEIMAVTGINVADKIGLKGIGSIKMPNKKQTKGVD